MQQSTENSASLIDLSEISVNPVSDKKRNVICQKLISFCYFCGKDWLFDRLSSSNDGGMWCNSDICGSICAIFTWLLILYPSVVLLFVVFIPIDSNWFRLINGTIFYTLVIMAVLSHIKSIFTDPGAVDKGNATEENISKLPNSGKAFVRCMKCNSIKPTRAHHCSVCQRCIRKMDHHCPWINNCVGEDNQKYFVMFTFYIFLVSSFALYICIHFFIYRIKDEWSDFLKPKNDLQKYWFEFSTLTKSLLLLSVAFQSIIFGLFTLIMCVSQFCSVANDRTGIESLQKETPKWERRSCWHNITSMFNYPFSWRWFCPLALTRKKYHEELHVV